MRPLQYPPQLQPCADAHLRLSACWAGVEGALAKAPVISATARRLDSITASCGFNFSMVFLALLVVIRRRLIAPRHLRLYP